MKRGIPEEANSLKTEDSHQSLEMNPEDVQSLQKSQRQLGHTFPAQETEQSQFDPDTRQVVQDFQHKTTLDRLVAIAGLAPEKQAMVREKVRGPAGLTDRKLKEMVEAGDLSDDEARELGLVTSLYHLCDEQADLAAALKDYQFPHLNGLPIERLTDLIPLEEADWQRALKDVNAQLHEGETVETYARRLRNRIERQSCIIRMGEFVISHVKPYIPPSLPK